MLTDINVYGLERAVNAISNSFNVGEINTVVDPSDRAWKVAKSLGSNKDAYQSHSAYLKGIRVSFMLKAPILFMLEFLRYHFVSVNPVSENWLAARFEYAKYVDERSIQIIEKLMNDLRNSQFSHEKETNEYLNQLAYTFPRGILKHYFVTTNYLQLKSIAVQRTGHRHAELWYEFLNEIYKLPKFCELTGLKEDDLKKSFEFVLSEESKC